MSRRHTALSSNTLPKAQVIRNDAGDEGPVIEPAQTDVQTPNRHSSNRTTATGRSVSSGQSVTDSVADAVADSGSSSSPVAEPAFLSRMPATITPRHEQPGTLWREAEVLVHTRSAHRLIVGRMAQRARNGKHRQRPLTGLLKFARVMRDITHHAQRDDPYADAFLMRVEATLEQIERRLDHTERWLSEQLTPTRTRAGVISRGSLKPTRVPVRFYSPYAWRALDLVLHYDTVVLTALDARHVGRLTQQDWHQRVEPATASLRQLFQLPMSVYTPVGVTRADLIEGTDAGLAAVNTHGPVDPDIVDGILRPRWVAPARSSYNAVEDYVPEGASRVSETKRVADGA